MAAASMPERARSTVTASIGPAPYRLDTTCDGWVIYPGMRFYSVEHSCWGTVGAPAYRDPDTCHPSLVIARYWDISLDNGRRMAVTGCHLLCHQPDDVTAWWDRHLCPDVENIADFQRHGVTVEDRMRADYPRLHAALVGHRRSLRDTRDTSVRDYHRNRIKELADDVDWIERTFRVRGLKLPTYRA
jgi:hypothetical protein